MLVPHRGPSTLHARGRDTVGVIDAAGAGDICPCGVRTVDDSQRQLGLTIRAQRRSVH